VDAVPPDVRPGAEKSILVEMLQTYREFQQRGASDTRDAVAKSYACRAAVKAGDPLSVPEMRSLLRDLAGASLPWVCPHGRPVMLRIPLDELDRRFGRI
jgi:DNA mismatch repair protein MutL